MTKGKFYGDIYVDEWNNDLIGIELVDEAKKEFKKIDASSPWAEDKWDDLEVWFKKWFGEEDTKRREG